MILHDATMLEEAAHEVVNAWAGDGAQPLNHEADRRGQARQSYDCAAHWRLSQPSLSEQSDHVAWARDASRTGASITLRSASPPAMGEHIRLTFHLDNWREWVVAPRAVVRWSRQVRENVWNIGVQFNSPTA